MTLGGWVGSLKAPLNALTFTMRSRLGLSRGVPELRSEPKSDLYDYVDDAQVRAEISAREAALRERYGLAAFRERSTRAHYRDGIYLLDALDRALSRARVSLPAEAVRAVDIGSKDFAYASPLSGLYRWFGADEARRVELEGVEIDGHGVYPDGFSRADYARAFAAQAGDGVRYTVADATRLSREGLDAVTLFYPFLFRFALLAWGLPLRHFEPERLLRHAARMLRAGGIYVVLTHTTEEKERLAELLGGVRELAVRDVTKVEGADLVDYLGDDDERWILVAVRTETAPLA